MRDHPVLRLSVLRSGAADGAHQFVAHGEVIANGCAVARVRLVNDAGQVLEDVVSDDGLVLFASVGPADVERPLRAELYDPSGRLVWKQAMPDAQLRRWPRWG